MFTSLSMLITIEHQRRIVFTKYSFVARKHSFIIYKFKDNVWIRPYRDIFLIIHWSGYFLPQLTKQHIHCNHWWIMKRRPLLFEMLAACIFPYTISIKREIQNCHFKSVAICLWYWHSNTWNECMWHVNGIRNNYQALNGYKKSYWKKKSYLNHKFGKWLKILHEDQEKKLTTLGKIWKLFSTNDSS